MTGVKIRDLPSPASWVKDAICDPGTGDSFYSEGRRVASEIKKAKLTCKKCPVQLLCLEVGMGEEHGIWGGYTPEERELLRKAGRR